MNEGWVPTPEPFVKVNFEAGFHSNIKAATSGDECLHLGYKTDYKRQQRGTFASKGGI